MFQDADFPLKLFVPIITIYLAICSLIVIAIDHSSKPYTRMSFGDAFYFSYMTMATIGLGDVMPTNVEHNPLIALTFPVGLTLLSIVNSGAYKQLEARFVSTMNNLELLLERLQHRPPGHMVFRWMAPNIEV
ncbi:unnamed protein product [Gongylonema pulchrum]|uniref:Ion_trans_2 domain-containing protein n=1 Tax=Gongylonema pulchrum TaxID=637853 RepID=A0A183CWS7_9BILA|nr:unnamed protein product [Gongylonema pulchrum]